MNLKYTKEMLETAAKDSQSIADVMRKLNIKRTGGSHSHLTRRFKFFNIDISHFCGKTKAKGRCGIRKTSNEILVERTDGRRQFAYQLRRAMLENNILYVCKKCNMEPIWNGKQLTFQIDHINGNWLDDRLDNLQFLCPNCHSQTPNYGAKNI